MNKGKSPRVKVVCMECDKRWSVNPNATDPRCSKCGSVDFEVV